MQLEILAHSIHARSKHLVLAKLDGDFQPGRKAFIDTTRDKQFLAEATKLGLELDVVTG